MIMHRKNFFLYKKLIYYHNYTVYMITIDNKKYLSIKTNIFKFIINVY